MRKAEFIGTGLFTAMLALPLVEGPGGVAGNLPEEAPWARPHVRRDLEQIKHDTLRVLVLPDPLTWEPRPKATTGLEWELLERFARRHKLAIKAIRVTDQDTMLLMLQMGEGDVIAAQLSAHGWAAPYVGFTRPYRHIAPGLALMRTGDRPKEHTAPQDAILMSSWSPFLDSLQRISFGDSAVRFRIADSIPDDLLMATALGGNQPLLVSDATATLEAKRLPLVQFVRLQGDQVPLAFAVRSNATHLLHAMDTWLASAGHQEERNALLAAYNNGLDTRGARQPKGAWAYGTDSISRFDSLFQAHADSSAWDWKLLAAVAYKESSFDTTARSYMGAQGLMQLMPKTAAFMGVPEGSGVNEHIQGATRYLARLDGIWRSRIKATGQRLKFVLASYNAGPGHVKDAQRLAVELGLDPDRWDGHVERAIVLLNRPRYFTGQAARNGYCRGQDTYWYVRDVLGVYGWVSGKPQPAARGSAALAQEH
ncbi:MAG: transglycosylase SLT domain-containing protein [Flavobacteriales bacterium]|nr:transglycosylase SLT domain-containing protein [Flavobacteriales bacterium]